MLKFGLLGAGVPGLEDGGEGKASKRPVCCKNVGEVPGLYLRVGTTRSSESESEPALLGDVEDVDDEEDEEDDDIRDWRSWLIFGFANIGDS